MACFPTNRPHTREAKLPLSVTKLTLISAEYTLLCTVFFGILTSSVPTALSQSLVVNNDVNLLLNLRIENLYAPTHTLV